MLRCKIKERQRPINWNDVPLFIDPAYIAWVLGIGYETVRKLIKNGEIRAKKVGTAWRISREDFMEYMNEGVC